MSKEDEREMCVHCGRHPTAFQEVQALREQVKQITFDRDGWADADREHQRQSEELREEVETLRELDEMHHGCPDFVELRERLKRAEEERDEVKTLIASAPKRRPLGSFMGLKLSSSGQGAIDGRAKGDDR